ncbi:hypothetical protein IBX65_02735 [Candidatus Aerophobetes bacterium]|nr:hypothetical protein [Candidatus Aerophobetes bacterium]
MDEEQIKLLVKLQDVDVRIEEGIKQKEVLTSELKQTEEKLKTLQDDILKKKEELKNTRKNKMGKELEVEDVDEKLQRHEDEKYKVKSRDEFEALEREIATLKKSKDREEDILLQLMEREDELFRLIPSLEKQFQIDRERLTKEKEKLEKRLVNLEKDEQSLTKERESLSSRISKVYYSQYEQLRRVKSGLAVAMVENGVCGGCNVTVSPSLVGQMRRGQIVYCESCSRITYLGKKGGN